MWIKNSQHTVFKLTARTLTLCLTLSSEIQKDKSVKKKKNVNASLFNCLLSSHEQFFVMWTLPSKSFSE